MTHADPDELAPYFERYGPAYRWLVISTTMMATITVVLSSTVVNVALPDIMGVFGIGQDQARLQKSAHQTVWIGHTQRSREKTTGEGGADDGSHLQRHLVHILQAVDPFGDQPV